MRTAEQITAEYKSREESLSPSMAAAHEVRAAYNGDLVVPVEGAGSPAVANLILTGIDQTAARIASVLPDITVPAEVQSEASEKKAARRRTVWKAWWEANRLPTMMRRRARYMIAYGTAPVIMGMDWKKNCPTWRVINPLMAFPSDNHYEDLRPNDMIVAMRRTAGWLRGHYPQQAALLPDDTPDHAGITLLEYVDKDIQALVLCGISNQYSGVYGPHNNMKSMFLEVVPNRTGETLAVVPRRVVLDRNQGQFDQMIGMYEGQARLTALSMIATEKAVFPDTYLISSPGELATFVDGPHDGRTGQVNIVRGGTVSELGSAPGMNTNPMIDRLERGQRIQGAVPAEFGGESQSNIRTGRRGDAVLSATIDMPIMEAQEAFAEALTLENKIAAQVSQAYQRGQTLSVYYTMGRKQVGTKFQPEVLFSSDDNKVSYPVTGTDMNQLIVSMGQRIGLGTMSKQTAAELDPLIEDPEQENDRITAEQLDTAVLASIQQAAQGGGLPPQVISRIADLVRHDKAELSDAVDQATKEYAEAQQAQQEAAVPPGMEGAATTEPGVLAEGPPGVQEAPQGVQNLAGLLRGLRSSTTNQANAGATGQPYRS